MRTTLPARPAASPANPTWDDNISHLFRAPYWFPEGTREAVGSSWIAAMQYWGPTDLTSYATVVKKATSIYQHLRSRSMPLTDDASHYFPPAALAQIRAWANQGFRRTAADSIAPAEVIPAPEEPEVKIRVRNDIRDLTPEELQTYRAKLDDVLGIASVTGKWQELGFLHANWCLHYREATFLWHRAYLRYVEELIDFPIPYWNCLAAEASNPTSEFAGLPREYREETYVHPTRGTQRNPLKYALGLIDAPTPPRYIRRDPVLMNPDTGSDKWRDKVAFFALYQSQVGVAMRQEVFSRPVAEYRPFGRPWANITEFTEDQSDSLYPNRADFDGLFEQPHDNIHGWVGPDMANNSFSAFDPVFLSYHANMDRITELYLRSQPGLTFTSTFPLHPFVEMATELSYDESREWRFTTIGDMVRDARSLWYEYAAPASADTVGPTIQQEEGGKGLVPYVVFRGVRCNYKSFHIDVFTADAVSLEPRPGVNEGYIGRDTRLGMGPGGGKGEGNMERCVKEGVTRILDARKWVGTLRGRGEVRQVVVEIETGRVVEEGEWRGWGCFEAEVVWGRGI